MDISQDGGPCNRSVRESQPVIVAEWELNQRESLRVELHEFKGTKLIGIRKWFPSSSGALIPGKHGINLSLRHLPRLAAAMDGALSKARADGLIADDGAEGHGRK